MLPLSLVGIWSATQVVAFPFQWVPAAPDMTQHYFLVVSKAPDGTIRAFIRNPEFNAGAFIGTREVAVTASTLVLHATGSKNVTGALNTDGTVTLDGVPPDGSAVRFHRATQDDLRWYYPSATASWHYTVPEKLMDGWPVATLADAGMSVAPLASFMNTITSLRTPALRSPYIQSVAIARHGRLVLDEYFYGFAPEYLHDVRSAGKSVTTLLVGRAIEDDPAFSATSRVLPLLPQYLPVKQDDARKEAMTVANLMTMASGLACDDNDDNSPGNEGTMQSQPAGTDWYRYTLDLPVLSTPGTRAIYCTAGINLLGAIVQTRTHVPLDRYFEERFAGPMQFGAYSLWLMPPPASAPYMGGGDRFRPRDFLKFGVLLLNHGKWNDRQIVDPQWISDSIVPRTAPEGEGDRYGYGWHISGVDVDGHSYEVINAGGNGGQLMIVVPELDVAIMVTAGNYMQFPVWRNFLPEVSAAVIRSCVDR